MRAGENGSIDVAAQVLTDSRQRGAGVEVPSGDSLIGEHARAAILHRSDGWLVYQTKPGVGLGKCQVVVPERADPRRISEL